MTFSTITDVIFFKALEDEGYCFNLRVSTGCCSYCVYQTEVPKRALNGDFWTTKGRVAVNWDLESAKFCHEAFFQGRLPLYANFWPSSMKKWNRPQIRFFFCQYIWVFIKNVENNTILNKMVATLAYRYFRQRPKWSDSIRLAKFFFKNTWARSKFPSILSSHLGDWKHPVA